MSVTVEWDNAEQTILRFDVEDRWTVEAFDQAKVRGDSMIDAVTHDEPIGVLLVMSSRVHLPAGVITGTRNGVLTRHPRIKKLMLVCDSGYVKVLWGLLVRVSPVIARIYKQADTLEQGREYLKAELEEDKRQSRTT